MEGREGFLREMERLIQELQRERDELQAHLHHVQARVHEVESRLAAAKKTWETYRSVHGIPHPQPDQEDFRSRYDGLTIRDALIKIAEENGGTLDVSEAIPVLVGCGMFRDARNAASSIYPTLHRLGSLFEKTGRGEYRMRDWREAADRLYDRGRES